MTMSGKVSSEEQSGLRGDPAAIADAEAMVQEMGGLAIWRELKSVHFDHEWDIFNRPDIYLENEILDLSGPRSHVTMRSETYSRVRAYSPEYRYWNIVNGEFSYASDEAYENAMERAPYSIYRLARAIAAVFHRATTSGESVEPRVDPQAMPFRSPAFSAGSF